MSEFMALCLVTAVLCGIWSFAAGALGLLAWAGFAGCTTYFACGSHGLLGVRRTILTNMAGVACGMSIFALTAMLPKLGEFGVWSGVITFVMCFLSKYKLLNYCPGIFVGCFSTFASGGDWKGVGIALLCGSILGVACDRGSVWLHKQLNKNERG